MRQQRWFPIAALAVGLFAINLVTRLVIRFAFKHDDGVESGASIVMFALIGLTLAVWAFRAAQHRKPIDWLVPDWFLGAVGALLLTVLVGPFVSGDQPFSSGAGNFFLQVWLYAGFAIVGTLLGYWVAVMLGIDYRSRSLKAYAQRSASKPRRVVRR
jgi:FtsH-binding integral membrane protein